MSIDEKAVSYAEQKNIESEKLLKLAEFEKIVNKINFRSQNLDSVMKSMT
jgi:hypothetical protein